MRYDSKTATQQQYEPRFFSLNQDPYHHARGRVEEAMAGHSAHRLNGSQRMGLSIKHDETSTFLSGVGRQPLRERHVCPNVNDDIPPQRCKEAHRQLRHPHARTLYHGKTHSARCAVRPAGQNPAVEHRPAAKEGQGQSKVLRVHRKVNVECSSSRPTATSTDATSTAALNRSTVEDAIGAPQALRDGRRRTSSGTMHLAVSGDVRGNLEHWRNHYSQSKIGSLSYVKSPLDVAVTDPTNASFASNTDPGRRKPSTFLTANGSGLSSQSRPRRRCWICGSERPHGSQKGATRAGDGGILGVQNQPVRRPPTARTGISLRPASAEGCWFCHGGGEAPGERPAGVGVDCRDVREAPSATVGGNVHLSAGRAPFDGHVDGPKVGDSHHNGSAKRRLEVSAGMQVESGVADSMEVHVGKKAIIRNGVDDVGEERGRREVQPTGSAADRLSGESMEGRDHGAGEQRRSAGECRENGGGLVGRGKSERLLDDGLATLRSETHRRFQERGRGKQKGTIFTDATRKKHILDLTSNGDSVDLGGRDSGGGYERSKCNSGKSDGEMGRKSVPQNGPRRGFVPKCETACFGEEGDGGRSLADVRAGAFFGDPLCWEEEGVWWFRPRVNDAAYDSHTAAVLRSRLNIRRNAEAKLSN